MAKSYRWTIILSILTIPLLIIAFFFAGGGDGTYLPAMGLFPFGLLGILFYNRITTPFILLSIIQYPVYGFLIDKATLVNKGKFILFILSIVHILLAATIIILTGESSR